MPMALDSVTTPFSRPRSLWIQALTHAPDRVLGTTRPATGPPSVDGGLALVVRWPVVLGGGGLIFPLSTCCLTVLFVPVAAEDRRVT